MNKTKEIKKIIYYPIFIIIFATLCLSIGYANINGTTLNIIGTVKTNGKKEIYIKNVTLYNSYEATPENSIILNYTGTMMQSRINLSEESKSNITYEVTIGNNSNNDVFFSGVVYDKDFYDNNQIIYELDGIKKNDILKNNESITFRITFKYKENIEPTNNTLNSYLNFKFSQNNDTFAQYLKELAESDTILKDDGTDDHNMRYMGASPNNYVTFEGETWRVIGAFNNIDDGTGKKETRVKIIRENSIENKVWDEGCGIINIWNDISLKSELQSLIYSSNLMVGDALWNLGNPGQDYAYSAMQAYNNEKNISKLSQNDLTWIGKVGLMYPSDYGFASSVCNDGSRSLTNYGDNSCIGSNWLHMGSREWLLSFSYDNDEDIGSFAGTVIGNGNVAFNGICTYKTSARPVVYLKSSVKCSNCNEDKAGSIDNPFILK